MPAKGIGMDGRIERFEQLVVWQNARLLTREIYRSTSVNPLSSDFGLSRQLQRASVSIMSNIAEGFGRFNPNEFHQFVVIAKVSCSEVRSLVYVALDCGYLDSHRFTELASMTDDVDRLASALRTSIDRKRRSPTS